MNKRHLHYVNGHWVAGSGPSITAKNPATAEIIWEGNSADSTLVEQAVRAAKTVFFKWSRMEFDQRATLLEKFRNRLLEKQESLAEAISQSTGKPLWEARGEVLSMANKITISIDSFKARCPTIKTPQAQSLSITKHRAHGAMAVLGPFNFPGHLPNGHIVPALLAGNTVIFKPSELAPLVAELTAQCWESCGLPSGVFNMIQGGKETGQLLSEHPEIDGLLFTGSWQTGKHLSEFMAKTPFKILALEMGGNNPLVVGTLADFNAAAYLTIQSAYLTSGQRCTCARRLIVPKGTAGDQFIEVLRKMIKKIRVGAYNDKTEPFMGPLISSHAVERLLNAQQDLISKGAQPLIPLARMDKGPAFLSPGLIDITSVADRPDEEFFGPFLQVIRVNNFQEALDEANRTKYGLAAGLLSDSKEEYEIFFNTIRAGIINWNTPLTGASSAAPFGGVGQSGNNRPSAFYAADYCAYPIASLVSEKLEMPLKISPGIDNEN